MEDSTSGQIPNTLFPELAVFRKCRADGCNRRVRRDNEHGYCQKHIGRSKKKPRSEPARFCPAPDCGKPLADKNESGYCKAHHHLSKERTAWGVCAAEGCGRRIHPTNPHGYCVDHTYLKDRKTFEPFERLCERCKKTKFLITSPNASSKKYCDGCKKAIQSEFNRQYRLTHREKIKKALEAWKKANPERAREHNLKGMRAFRDRQRAKLEAAERILAEGVRKPGPPKTDERKRTFFIIGEKVEAKIRAGKELTAARQAVALEKGH